MMTPYATIDDLELGWRTLTPAEVDRAEILLLRASLKVRRRFPRVDDRIASGDLDLEEVVTVVTGMVQRVLASPTGGDAIAQLTQSAGPYSTSATYANPQGNLYFTAEDVRALSKRRSTSLKLNLPLGF